jgi:hypothetical protein
MTAYSARRMRLTRLTSFAPVKDVEAEAFVRLKGWWRQGKWS